ncbi:hypothetical protein HQ619_07580 [Burkholderia gladioli]|jgi:hypothetical protein|uniref:hypothetical protein n=1 Tax=Burkholderia gladioli TaxID=28095 RepID=UPI0015610813|nr:hypothetical protein [Burkholderia gladioli]NRF83787.1 hypothetical protein [Burkholderia gladioli]
MADAIIVVEFESEWDDGTVSTRAQLNLATGEVFDIESYEHYENLLSESVVVNGRAFSVFQRNDGSYCVNETLLPQLQAEVASVNLNRASHPRVKP